MNNNIKQTLNKGWQFKNDDEDSWSKANVPGCVHLDLIQNRLIPDPFQGDNEKKLQWIMEKKWTYRLLFSPEKKLLDKKNISSLFFVISQPSTFF